MNVRAAIRAAWDALVGRFITRTAFDRSHLTFQAVSAEVIAGALAHASSTGYLRQIADIHDMMPATDEHLYGIRRQLRAGVQGLEMEPVAISEDPLAVKAAAVCKDAMERPGASWSALTTGILEGVLRGASLTETLWDDPQPGRAQYWNGFLPAPEQRLRYNWSNGELLLITDPSKPNEALRMDELPPGKFVRCQVDTDIPDFSMRGGYRAILPEWFARSNVAQWEQMAIERYGMPIPVGKYAGPDGKEALKAAMQEFGAAGMLLIDRDSQMEWGLNSFRELIHEEFMEKSAERMSVALLGASQTATIGKQAGSLASARVHEGIRRDVLFALADIIAECVRRDLFVPFLRVNQDVFGAGIHLVAPKLKAQFDEPLDLLTTAQAWDVLENQLGFKIPDEYAKELTGIPFEPRVENRPRVPALAPVAQFPAPRAIAAAAERVKVPLPPTPHAFGRDVAAPLAHAIETAPLAEMADRVKSAPKRLNESADLLAAEMFAATMRAMEETRRARG